MKMTVLATALASLLVAIPVYAYDLTVTAGAQNQVVSGSKTYTVPQGTTSVGLLYNVYTAEYPHYVTAQSVFNDVWSLSLTGNGTLYNITRQVNSQLTQEPTWLANSTTGDIRKTIDVTGLTVNGPLTLQINATAMNVGDSALATSVYASLEQPPQLTITAANPDSITTNNTGNYYSIPAVGDTNTLQRYFTLNLSKGNDITLRHVTVTVRGPGDLMDVVHQLPIPSGSDVQIINQSDTNVTMKVRVTMLNPTSTVNGSPPPTRDLEYLFHVEGENGTGQTVSATMSVTGRRPLWRTVNLLPGRYSVRTDGHDDWGARGTYIWLQQNNTLIREVGDISGEHGRQIGHPHDHQYGTDMDVYHFYRFPGAVSGTQNFEKLKNTVTIAFGTLLPNGQPNPTPSANALNAVISLKDYVNATRTGLQNLAALNTVRRMYYSGWARTLIETGKITRTTQTLDLGLGNWSNNKLAYNSVHDNHLHIALDRPAIGE